MTSLDPLHPDVILYVKQERQVILEQSAYGMVELQLGVVQPDDVIEIQLQYAVQFKFTANQGCISFIFPSFLPKDLQSVYSGNLYDLITRYNC